MADPDFFPKFPHLRYPVVDNLAGQNFYIIENWINSLTNPAAFSETDPVTFSYPGTLTTGVESPPFYPTVDTTYLNIRVSQLVVGALDLKIDIKLNGTIATTVTLTAGDLTVVDSVTTIATTVGDYVTVNVNDQGDAANVSVELYR